jgi:hypothetical protein
MRIPSEEGTERSLQELADLLGESSVDLEDEHERWRLYQLASEAPEVRPCLLRAVGAEPVPALASAAVVMLLERTEHRLRGQLIEILDPTVREFPEKRAKELGILESVRMAGDTAEVSAQEIDGWTDWLQTRVVESSASRGMLALLADRGRTKRIRRSAQQAQALLP